MSFVAYRFMYRLNLLALSGSGYGDVCCKGTNKLLNLSSKNNEMRRIIPFLLLLMLALSSCTSLRYAGVGLFFQQ